MARTLTTPAVQPDAVQQAIVDMRFEIPHYFSDPDMKINKPTVRVWYSVATYDTDGNIISNVKRNVSLVDWPAGFKTDIKGAYAKLHNDAENAGLIAGVGTDEAID